MGAKANKIRSVEDAVGLVRSRDSVAVPLGPGQPAVFLHALGEREAFDDLTVFGALFIDLFPLFIRPGVRLLSVFFGPVQRGLVQAGFDVQFVSADFRRFAAVCGGCGDDSAPGDGYGCGCAGRRWPDESGSSCRGHYAGPSRVRS